MESRAEQDDKALDLGWENAQALRSDLKSGVRDDDDIHHSKPPVKSLLRRTSLFSRRKNTSLVNRIIWLLLIWSVVVYVIGVAGLWWSSNKVIEDNFSQQATDWVAKLDELGTPLYAANDEFLFQSIEDQIHRFPEVSSRRSDRLDIRLMHDAVVIDEGTPGRQVRNRKRGELDNGQQDHARKEEGALGHRRAIYHLVIFCPQKVTPTSPLHWVGTDLGKALAVRKGAIAPFNPAPLGSVQ